MLICCMCFFVFFFFSSRRRHTRCALVTGVQTCALPIFPTDWRQTHVRRADLDRFLFAPEDVIVAVGQDGLVANVAKYLDGQPVLGVNPAPDLYDGVLVRVALDRLGAALPASLHDDVAVDHRDRKSTRLNSSP